MPDLFPFPDALITASVYLVGGAVRDQLLGRPVGERDWVVVGATRRQLLAAGYRQADPEFPVFLHPQTGEEYALARRETKIGDGYRGFALEVSPEITLDQDLARRDLTVNAMAYTADGSLIDPFGGRDDLEQGRLRHVTAAFVEDPVRLLRIARFAAQLGEGFRVTHATQRLLREMVAGGAIDQLQPQRIGREAFKALAAQAPWRFFEVLSGCAGLSALLPGLAGRIQAGHGKPDAAPPLRVLRRISQTTADPALRLCALLLQSGDPPERAIEALDLGRRAAQLTRSACAAWPRWQALPLADPAAVAGFLGDLRCWGQDRQCAEVLSVLRAQARDSETGDRLDRALQAARAVPVAPLQQAGLSGAALGQAIAEARTAAIRKVLES